MIGLLTSTVTRCATIGKQLRLLRTSDYPYMDELWLTVSSVRRSFGRTGLVMTGITRAKVLGDGGGDEEPDHWCISRRAGCRNCDYWRDMGAGRDM